MQRSRPVARFPRMPLDSQRESTLGASLVRLFRSRVAVAMNSCVSPMRFVVLSQGVAIQIFDWGLSCSFSERSPQLRQHKAYLQRPRQQPPHPLVRRRLPQSHRPQSLHQLRKRLHLQ
jgi:hypothetical protein